MEELAGDEPQRHGNCPDEAAPEGGPGLCYVPEFQAVSSKEREPDRGREDDRQ